MFADALFGNHRAAEPRTPPRGTSTTSRWWLQELVNKADGFGIEIQNFVVRERRPRVLSNVRTQRFMMGHMFPTADDGIVAAHELSVGSTSRWWRERHGFDSRQANFFFKQ